MLSPFNFLRRESSLPNSYNEKRQSSFTQLLRTVQWEYSKSYVVHYGLKRSVSLGKSLVPDLHRYSICRMFAEGKSGVWCQQKSRVDTNFIHEASYPLSFHCGQLEGHLCRACRIAESSRTDNLRVLAMPSLAWGQLLITCATMLHKHCQHTINVQWNIVHPLRDSLNRYCFLHTSHQSLRREVCFQGHWLQDLSWVTFAHLYIVEGDWT